MLSPTVCNTENNSWKLVMWSRLYLTLVVVNIIDLVRLESLSKLLSCVSAHLIFFTLILY